MAEQGKGILGGLGLDSILPLGQVQNTVEQLTNALQSTGEKVTGTVSSLVEKLKENAMQLKEASRKEGGQGQATDLYNRMVARLQDASRRGEEQAGQLLGQLGEKVQAGGQQMQETASQGQEQRRT